MFDHIFRSSNKQQQQNLFIMQTLTFDFLNKKIIENFMNVSSLNLPLMLFTLLILI